MNTNVVQCTSPIDESIYAERPLLNPAQAKAMVTQAQQNQRDWAAQSLEERIDLIRAGIARLGDMSDVIVPELAWQMGRPVRYGGEFNGVRERALYMAQIADQALAAQIVEDNERFERRITREPHGVVLVIAPWNYPFMTAINSLVPALIAGNSVVLKHSSQTLLAGERLVSAFHNAGVPQAVLQNVFLDHATTGALIADRCFDFVSFTGSLAGGLAIEQAAAGTFTGIGLELGGKDAAYVMADAQLDVAVDTLIDAAMFNSGQSCCGIERIYVCADHYDEFIARSIATVEGYSLGNPLEQQTTLGPMAHRRFATEVRKQTQQALSLGATEHIRPFSRDDGGTYLSPQVLSNVDHNMSIMRDETFGPVVGIMKARDDEHAIQLMNDSDYGLTASLWTQDAVRAAEMGAQIDVGTVFMNRADYLDPALCWSGRKNTGQGGALSMIGFHQLTQPKSYHFNKAN